MFTSLGNFTITNDNTMIDHIRSKQIKVTNEEVEDMIQLIRAYERGEISLKKLYVILYKKIEPQYWDKVYPIGCPACLN